MPLRAAMPKTVKKPTSDPSDTMPPAIQAAITPPTRAIGSVRKTSRASAPARNDACSSSRIRMPVTPAVASSRLWAVCRSCYSPSTSAW